METGGKKRKEKGLFLTPKRAFVFIFYFLLEYSF
jgi:hypothetical protein